jgi:Diacylglycerol kinase catalytic domain
MSSNNQTLQSDIMIEENKSMSEQIAVIATTISGSVKDWGKVKRIVPLFREHGFDDVQLFSEDTHAAAKKRAEELVGSGVKWVISAGGSGTFNAVVDGCLNAKSNLSKLRIGFLRKGSADLLGKVLNMPDEIEDAIRVFANSIRNDTHIPCDVIQVTDTGSKIPPRRILGYGGFEIFGEVPFFTENRYTKYYKGVLSQVFGDLGPFFTGMVLATGKTILGRIATGTRRWNFKIDGGKEASGQYQALIMVNGYLGPNLPFAKGKALGSGEIYLFGVRDVGIHMMPGQIKKAWDSSILEDPERWGFDAFTITKQLEIKPADKGSFPVNVDGSTMRCTGPVSIKIENQIKLISKE